MEELIFGRRPNHLFLMPELNRLFQKPKCTTIIITRKQAKKKRKKTRKRKKKRK